MIEYRELCDLAAQISDVLIEIAAPELVAEGIPTSFRDAVISHEEQAAALLVVYRKWVHGYEQSLFVNTLFEQAYNAEPDVKLYNFSSNLITFSESGLLSERDELELMREQGYLASNFVPEFWDQDTEDPVSEKAESRTYHMGQLIANGLSAAWNIRLLGDLLDECEPWEIHTYDLPHQVASFKLLHEVLLNIKNYTA